MSVIEKRKKKYSSTIEINLVTHLLKLNVVTLLVQQLKKALR